MPIPYFKSTVCSALLSILFIAPIAATASAVDQSQLNYNSAMAFSPGIGQSFQAGISGLLTEIDVFANGSAIPKGGSNSLTLQVYSGDGLTGPSLGKLTETVSVVAGNQLDINAQGLSLDVIAGKEYTFNITNVTGSDNLATLGLLADSANPYAFGQAYNSAPTWDLAFETQVSKVSTPATLYLLAAGFFGLARWCGRKNAA